MKSHEVLKLIEKHPLYHGIKNQLLEKEKQQVWKGIKGSYAAMWVAHFYNLNELPFVCVFNTLEDARYFQADVDALLGSEKSLFFPESFNVSFDPKSKSSNLIQERTEVLNSLAQNNLKIIITYTQAIAEKVSDKKALAERSNIIKTGERHNFDDLCDWMELEGFAVVDFVVEPGEFAIRGGIIDVFSFVGELPYRIEFDGNTINSIRSFSPETQLSEQEFTSLNLLPDINQSVKNNPANNSTLLDHCSSTVVVFGQDVHLSQEQYAAEFEKNEFVSSSNLFLIPKALDNFLLHKKSIFTGIHNPTIKGISNKKFNCEGQTIFHKKFDLFTEQINEYSKDGITTLIFSEKPKQIERLDSILEDKGLETQYTPVYLGLSSGFLDKDLKVAFYTEHQLFGRLYLYKQKRKFTSNQGLTLRELKGLTKGDFVVHIDHGVGKYMGLQMLDNNGKKQESVRLEYKDGDLVYVSIHSLHKLSKYSGKEGTQPKLHKLGSPAWQKQKLKTKKKIKDIARDLILLYAKRKSSDGFAFSPDTYLQVEMEASFPYEDTPDQATTALAVKNDMEKENPMDRLVCGDVGFGKTEIAMRAAFKAVADNKQVAILVPTTLLAFQHYKSFKERLKDLPCNISYISRFRTAKQVRTTLQKLAEGELDIIIGTHKLLSKDVKFKNLGLIVIDEEQKFGVAAKEKLKKVRVNVDTLSLTATPIPRTLHFSLMGMRDLSIMNTPPVNRHPVATYLQMFNKETLKEAITKEVNRGGQVFFVHHRVGDIESFAYQIRQLCPGIKVAVGHGQMDGNELESVMLKFVNGDFDVLVATTIIESGIDIPNANTIIINNAHMFGLSDLHQMRGRVGRSHKRAFCHLMVPGLDTLPEQGLKRLKTLVEFNELGSGFNIAMRDLDIRGAGNLLGGEQSGFVTEIGFDMYHKILDEAIIELRKTEFKELDLPEYKEKSESDCKLDVSTISHFPSWYIENDTERINLYNQLANLKTVEELDLFTQQLKDRFGKLPDEVLALFRTLQIRWLGSKIGFDRISHYGVTLKLYPPISQDAPFFTSGGFNKALSYLNHHPQNAHLKESKKGVIIVVNNIKNLIQAHLVLDEMWG